ncbi:MAG: carboxypeptidase regulatory-like domain-containing protein [Bacteroidales bacterium]|nr:carboxypeptidase regulatory-like domain-containing protein [Bacteroidales bacterium]
MKKYYSLIAMSALMLLSVWAFGQGSTTAALTGQITDAKGATLPGATIQAIHQPSGTAYGTVTNDKGRYSIQGMRVGGPYKIIISFVGFSNVEYGNVQLSLGDASVYNSVLTESASQLGEVIVSANLNDENAGGGAATNYKEDQIVNAPTVDRNIYDVAKLSPLVMTTKVGGISIAGSNNRYNSFQIDGMVSNDVFGLAGSGTNGGQTGANPISLDAIQEIQVLISPFDVRQGGFTGGGINAITKSGTNQFHGSAYGYFNNQSMYGSWSQVSESKAKLTDESTKTMGFSVGGPIIKDKLFFFVNAEYKFDTYPSDYYAGYKDGYISTGEAKAILDRYKSITGFDDSYGRRNLETKGLSILGRLDWNINKNNKFSLRYQLNDSYKDVYAANAKTYYFANSGYRMVDKTNSVVAELNTHINNSLYNELRAGLTMVRDNRDVSYQAPNVYIKNVGGTYDASTNLWSEGSTAVNIGTEYYSGANLLNQDIYTIEDNLSWYKGNHTITFGTHNEFYKMHNLFIPASNGAYSYNSLNEFMHDSAYQFAYQYSDYDLTGSYKWAATVKAGQFGLYAQDKWNISENFDLTYGVRLDIPTFFNKPSTNNEFNQSDYALKYGVKVGEVPSTKLLVSPRVGFRWYTNDSHKTLLRGGTGIFTGREPLVWLSNVWSNTGVEMKGTTISSNVPSFETYGNDPIAAMNSASGSASKPTINTVSKDFKYPQVFRSNLALEQILPGDWKVTLEGLYSKTMNNVWWENLALTDEGTKVYAVSADDPNSSTIYWSRDAGSYYAIVNLKNTNKGYTYNLSAKVEKSFDLGFDLMAGYTFGHAYSVNDGTSSIAYSNWKYNYSVNPNDANELSYSLFDVPNRVIAVLSYTTPKYLNKKLSTVVSLVYNGFNGQRYSLTMNESKDFNNDGQYGNSLLYIPTTSELAKMTFASEDDRTSYGNWIEGDKYAKDNRGQYAERYSNSAPWESHFDLHLAEDFYYAKEKGGKISLTFDILNVGNLINKDWGASYSSYYNVQILKVTALTTDADGNKIPTYSFQGSEVTKSDIFSRWHAQIGLRVTF